MRAYRRLGILLLLLPAVAAPLNALGQSFPSGSPALVNLSGSVLFGPNSTILIEVGGLARGTQYDAIESTGTISLAGRIEVALLGGFTPALGNTFDILHAAGGVAGQFNLAASSFPGLPGGLGWKLAYTPTTVQLVVAPALSADFDEDGDVDGADLAKWQAGFGTATSATHMQGDADADADADGADFLAWQRQLGGAAVTATAAIPEPAAFSLLILALGFIRPRR